MNVVYATTKNVRLNWIFVWRERMLESSTAIDSKKKKNMQKPNLLVESQLNRCVHKCYSCFSTRKSHMNCNANKKWLLRVNRGSWKERKIKELHKSPMKWEAFCFPFVFFLFSFVVVAALGERAWNFVCNICSTK